MELSDVDILRMVEAWVVQAIKAKRYPFTGQLIATELGLEWLRVLTALETLEREGKIERML